MNTNPTTRVTTESHSVALTADCAIFGFSEDALRVLIVRRAVLPYKGEWVLPGGAMHSEETLEQTAIRVLRDLVNVENVPMQQVCTYSSVDRHPVRRVVTTSYFALVSPDDHAPIARKYLDQVKWCKLSELPRMGFDHRRILDDAYEALKEGLRAYPLAFHLLPGQLYPKGGPDGIRIHSRRRVGPAKLPPQNSGLRFLNQHRAA